MRHIEWRPVCADLDISQSIYWSLSASYRRKDPYNYYSAIAKGDKRVMSDSKSLLGRLRRLLASNSDFTLFEAVNMWWDFLEISWTLEISVLLLKYLLCKQALCPQLGGVTVSSHRWLADSAFLPPLHSLQHAKLSKVGVALWGQQLSFSRLLSLRVFSKNKEVFCWKPVDFSITQRSGGIYTCSDRKNVPS